MTAIQALFLGENALAGRHWRDRLALRATAPQPMPGDIDRENYEDVEVNPIHVVAEDPVSTFSIDADTASYSNVRRMLNDGHLPPQDAVRTEELINYFRYDYPLPHTREQPFSTSVTVAPSPWAEGRQLVHIGLQGYNIIPRERPPLNLTLLKSSSIVGVFWGASTAREPELHKSNVRDLFKLYAEGKVKPRISARYPLRDGGKAIRALMDRTATGKLVVTME